MSRYSIYVAGDMHVNSAVALCPPDGIDLDDGGKYMPSETQRWLWDCWHDDVHRFLDASSGTTRIAILNGDLGDIDAKKRSSQMVSRNNAVIADTVLSVLAPLTDMVDHVFVVRGTPAHTGKSAWLEELVARDLDNAVRYSDSVSSWWHLREQIGGVRFDICHHARMGGIPWTRPNAVLNAAAKITYQYLAELRQEPPHIAVRSHNHKHGDSYDAHPVRMLYLPCYSAITEFGYRIGYENTPPDIGCRYVFIEDGNYKIVKRDHRIVDGGVSVWKSHMNR